MRGPEGSRGATEAGRSGDREGLQGQGQGPGLRRVEPNLGPSGTTHEREVRGQPPKANPEREAGAKGHWPLGISEGPENILFS